MVDKKVTLAAVTLLACAGLVPWRSSADSSVSDTGAVSPSATSSTPNVSSSTSSSGSTSSPPSANVALPASAAADDASALKVKTLEERVNELKEKIFRTKARLQNLQEMVIGGDLTTGSKAVLIHRNEMGSSFVLESVAYALDGAPIYAKVDVNGDLDKKEEFEIFNGRIVPGNHQISVKLNYRGHGYGVFNYLEGYKFKVQSSYTFNADPGKASTIKIVGFEKGNITTDLKDKPAVRYDIDVQKETADPRSLPEAAAKLPAAGTPPGMGGSRK